MLEHIIKFSLRNKLIILLFMGFVIGFGIYSLTKYRLLQRLATYQHKMLNSLLPIQ